MVTMRRRTHSRAQGAGLLGVGGLQLLALQLQQLAQPPSCAACTLGQGWTASNGQHVWQLTQARLPAHARFRSSVLGHIHAHRGDFVTLNG